METIRQNIFELIKNQQTEVIKKLLVAAPQSANLKDERGFTPLILAAYTNAGEIVNILLDSGAAINDQDAAGNTALMGVCFKGSRSIALDLIKRGADLNIQNRPGATALIYAAT
ncbi:MAG: ankyrin repeat domain-containing protein, partial [Marinoscillum sp.]